MLLGPVFSRELVTAPRRKRMYAARAVYAGALLVVMCTAWLALAGTQNIRNVGDMARFGALLFQLLAPLQLIFVTAIAAFSAASAVAQEKDRRTMVLLLMTRLANHELVLGKLAAALLHVLVMLVAGLPIFLFAALLGGVSLDQIARVFAVSFATAVLAGTLGSTLGQWREKTFQALALTALVLVFWIGFWEVVAAGVLGETWGPLPVSAWAEAFSPARALVAALRPTQVMQPALGVLGQGVFSFVLVSLGLTVLLNGLTILRVRKWNQTPELRRNLRKAEADAAAESIFGAEHDLSQTANPSAADERSRAEHVDAQLHQDRGRFGESRRVWDNPVLWREVRTWAYGRKVLFIRLAYLVMFVLVAASLHSLVTSGAALKRGDDQAGVIPPAARPLVPFFVLSLVILNARAATSITSERDGGSLDLLLVTDLTPREFVLGKLGGVIWVTCETLLAPILLSVYLWWSGGLTAENLLYVSLGLVVMSVFAATLGIHCGLTYASSRTAIGVSLGTVFFLFLGVATLLVIMVSFSNSFQVQLAPFLVFILGGAIGLFVALGSRNPSSAIGTASFLLPFATFWAITSFLLGHTLGVFAVTVGAFGFTTVALLLPAISEFDVATARSSGQEE